MTKVVPNNALTSYWELWKFFKQLTSEEKQGSVIFPVTNAEGTNELTLNLSEWAHTFPETDESGPKVSVKRMNTHPIHSASSFYSLSNDKIA